MAENVHLPRNAQGDVYLPVAKKYSYSYADAVAAMRRMVLRSNEGLCGAEECENAPTDKGLVSKRDEVMIYLCPEHIVQAQGESARITEFPHTILSYDGESQRVQG